ncbi:Uncharacterized protein FKW44_018497 [Caligus rogercresseyi]|uniref:Uncharacterized protein n=1 Tax=Caligus rogercresseyi TaxID=217165 RepID=A0A7T8GV14_CALRO|nr:Uncharacterized protein FKW44_018497 [Caligus rogercresseyi]
MNELFDVTKVIGQWLCKEDKNLYELQMQSKGQVGYSTGKCASAQNHLLIQAKEYIGSGCVQFSN